MWQISILFLNFVEKFRFMKILYTFSLIISLQVMTIFANEPDPVYVFSTKEFPVYRIPAIATTQNGTLIAVADYRYGGHDIGFGSVELQRRISKDNGKTWGYILELTHGQYTKTPQPKYDAAYGDPCIVSDRTSNRTLLMSCSGNTPFPSGLREDHQGIARFYSNDEGITWSEPDNLESTFYGFFDHRKRGPVSSMFIASGRICQSRQVKYGKYYRLYCSIVVKEKPTDTSYNDYVVYSDDFGENWHLLGDADTPSISGGDEPKVEELPDGRVLCSSRVRGGRKFNIFTYTDKYRGKGTWAKDAFSGEGNNGVISPACNGEIMIVPVTRLSDGKAMHLALHSTPADTKERKNVGIFYKGLPDRKSYSTPEIFAANWEGLHQSTTMPSAYSTFTLMQNGHIGFFYEETTFGKEYTLVFKDYTIETLTDGKYSFRE